MLALKDQKSDPRAAVQLQAKGQKSPRRAHRQLYEDLWDDLDWFRLVLAEEDGWKDGLRSPFQAALDPATRAEDAEEVDRVVFVGTDATQWSFAAINWESGEMIRELLQPHERRLVRAHAEGGAQGAGFGRVKDAIFIGVIELAAVVYAALQWGEAWQGRLVVAITDSVNALRWLRKRTCRNRFGQHLLRVLARLEMKHGFEVWPERVTSTENTLPDCACRRWKEDGSSDAGQEARWERLLEAYQGPAISEVPVVAEMRGERMWFMPTEWEQRELRLPGETDEDYSDRLHTGDAMRAPLGPVRGRPAGGRDWSRRIQGEEGGELDRSADTYLPRLARAVDMLWLASLAKTSATKYGYDWKHWEAYCLDRHISPWLTGTDRRADIQLLLEFVADAGVLLGRRYTTVEGKLCAIRWYHLQAGLGNPLADTPAIKAALRGLKRRQGETQPKLPVTIEALRRIRGSLDMRNRDHVVKWAAIITAFLFMLRASEYLADDSGRFDAEKGLTWADVEFRRQGKSLAPADRVEPDEVVLHLRASKNDQFRAGASRNHLVNDHTEYCAVRALWTLWKGAGQVELNDPVFALPGGQVLRRGAVSTILKVAAVEVGMPEARVSSHSLRHGGATAMYHAGMTEAEIKWLGRWLSNAWMLYVHRTSGRSKGVATRMFDATYELLARPS